MHSIRKIKVYVNIYVHEHLSYYTREVTRSRSSKHTQKTNYTISDILCQKLAKTLTLIYEQGPKPNAVAAAVRALVAWGPPPWRETTQSNPCSAGAPPWVEGPGPLPLLVRSRGG